jgi:magnesium chelatase subunit D
LAHKATRLPDTAKDDREDPPEAPPPETDAAAQDDADTPQSDTVPQEMLIAAIAAALPHGLLATLSARTPRATGSGAGDRRVSKRRGRPLPSRPGKPDGRSRVDLIATLRAAAPWQTLRKRARPRGDSPAAAVIVHLSDIRLKRYQERSERLLIFAVDASGSAAVARLGEAKGAVELLLADAYASRDHVALISFRGQGADLLLPPTRSLVQTKRRLAALPGGGGTPLAAGLQHAEQLARTSRGKGMSPTLVLLTDGRANIALDGTANREAARTDAETIAAALRRAGTPGLVIDTGKRPSAPLEALSGVLNSPYIALPRADAHSLQTTVSAALAQ